MDGWDLVFTAGNHTDSKGNVKNWTTEDLDRIVNSFNPSFHEPPVVIGHPSDNAPAFGWVGGIKRVGNDLYLKYKQVADEFKEWNRKGLFKKKSIAVYPDGSLRHVGYLGAMPPAIKGLPDFQFSDDGKGEAVTYEFSDWRMTTVGRVIMKIRDYLVEKEGADKADSIIGSWEVQDLLTPPPEPECIESSYHEEVDMKAEEVQALIKESLNGVTQQFAELLKPVNESIASLRTEVQGVQKQFAEGEDAQARREFTAFCESLKTRVIPAEIPTLVDQMMNLRKAPAVEFSEGGEKKSRPAVDDFRLKLQSRAETVQFNEFATEDRAGKRPQTGNAIELARKVSTFMEAEGKAGRTVTYAEALVHVENESNGGAA